MRSDNDRRHDPPLRLREDRPLTTSRNEDAQDRTTSGATCEFVDVSLEHDEGRHVEAILISGHCGSCASASHARSTTVGMVGGNHDESNPKVAKLPSHTVAANARGLPAPFDRPSVEQTVNLSSSQPMLPTQGLLTSLKADQLEALSS